MHMPLPINTYLPKWKHLSPADVIFLILWHSLQSIFLLQHVIRAQRAINNEMAHQLYVLQVLTFNLLEDRMMTKMDPQDQVSIWHDLSRTGRSQPLIAVPEALHGGKDTARNACTVSLSFKMWCSFVFSVCQKMNWLLYSTYKMPKYVVSWTEFVFILN